MMFEFVIRLIIYRWVIDGNFSKNYIMIGVTGRKIFDFSDSACRS